jgi:hypothetical protein
MKILRVLKLRLGSPFRLLVDGNVNFLDRKTHDDTGIVAVAIRRGLYFQTKGLEFMGILKRAKYRKEKE